MRTSSFKTLTSTPNDCTTRSASEVASFVRALMTSPPIPARKGVRSAQGDDPAMVDDRDPVAALRFLHQVGSEENGHILLVAEAIKRLPEIDPRAGIEPGGRLIEQQKLWAMEQTFRDLDPALQSAG